MDRTTIVLLCIGFIVVWMVFKHFTQKKPQQRAAANGAGQEQRFDLDKWFGRAQDLIGVMDGAQREAREEEWRALDGGAPARLGGRVPAAHRRRCGGGPPQRRRTAPGGVGLLRQPPGVVAGRRFRFYADASSAPPARSPAFLALLAAVEVLVFQLDGNAAAVAGGAQRRERRGPTHLSVAGNGVAPVVVGEPRRLGERRLADAVPILGCGRDLGVLAMGVAHVGGELLREANRIDTGGDQVRRVVVDADGRRLAAVQDCLVRFRGWWRRRPVPASPRSPDRTRYPRIPAPVRAARPRSAPGCRRAAATHPRGWRRC